MFNDDEEPKDWELKEEEPPPRLREKWEREEASGSGFVICPSCKKETSAGPNAGASQCCREGGRPNPSWGKEIKNLDGNLTCIFCGESISQAVCPVRGFLSWFKQFFRRS